MYDTILIPTDGSRGTEIAVARALDLARTSDATIDVLHVTEGGQELDHLDAAERADARDRAERRGREATVRIREQAADLGLESVRAVHEGTPYRTILDYVGENDIDLVVMGTHGKTGATHTGLGSTTERVVALSDVPVLSVPLADETAVPESGYTMYDHVVVPTDGSDAAERAARHGLDIAERYGADVHVVYVVDSAVYDLEDAPRSIVGLLKQGGQKAVDEIAAATRDRNLPVTTDVLRGAPHEEILDYADGTDADVIAMGTRGRTLGTGRLLGSTTSRVVRRADTPVLTSH